MSSHPASISPDTYSLSGVGYPGSQQIFEVRCWVWMPAFDRRVFRGPPSASPLLAVHPPCNLWSVKEAAFTTCPEKKYRHGNQLVWLQHKESARVQSVSSPFCEMTITPRSECQGAHCSLVCARQMSASVYMFRMASNTMTTLEYRHFGKSSWHSPFC